MGLLLAAPMLLGPAAPWAMRALGGAPEHHCACGMKRGKCGCPECAEQEHARAQSKARSERPVLRSTCDDDDAPMPNAAPLPRVTMPAEVAFVAAPPEVLLALLPPAGPNPRGRDAPPTPPPRHLG